MTKAGIFIIFGLLFFFTSPKVFAHEKISTRLQTIDSSIEGLLLDGWYHIYFDIGANIGVHVRKLFEPEKYPNSPYVPIFDDVFGDVEFRRRHTCAIGFELNPVHSEHLTNLQHCYNSKGWRTHFFVPRAVGNSDVHIHHMFPQNDPRHKDWTANVRETTGNSQGGIPIRSLDLPRFIEAHVCSRKIPELSNATKKPWIQAKIDIEGSEYSLLPGMLLHRNFCCINGITIEYHERFLQDPFRIHQIEIQKHVVALAEVGYGCSPSETVRSTISLLDDEFYLEDQQPAPEGCDPFTFL